MLSVIRRDLKQPADPLGPKMASSKYPPALKDGYLEKHFASVYSPCVIVELGNDGFMAYATGNDLTPNPRAVFSKTDGIYCLCRGTKAMAEHKIKSCDVMGNDSDFLISLYHDLVQNGNKNPLELLHRYLDGEYIFFFYDSFAGKKRSDRPVIAVHSYYDTPLYYGLDSEGVCILSDSLDIISKVCGELENIRHIPNDYVLQIPLSKSVRRRSLEAGSGSGTTTAADKPSKKSKAEKASKR